MSADDWQRPPEGHRDVLEHKLLERFDATRARHRPHAPWLRIAAPVTVLLAVLAATRVPAEYPVEVGKRLTFALPAGVELRSGFGERVMALLQDERARVLNVEMRMTRSTAGAASAELTVWGDRLAAEDLVVRRLSALPELQGVEVKVEALQGRVRDNLLHSLGYRLFQIGASSQDRAAARLRLIEELRAQAGEDAEVQVEVDERTGKVRATVRRVKRPGETPPPEPER